MEYGTVCQPCRRRSFYLTNLRSSKHQSKLKWIIQTFEDGKRLLKQDCILFSDSRFNNLLWTWYLLFYLSIIRLLCLIIFLTYPCIYAELISTKLRSYLKRFIYCRTPAPVDKLLFLVSRAKNKQTDSAILISSEAGSLRWWSIYGKQQEMGIRSLFRFLLMWL